jgi:hypothetical protein
MYVQCVKFPLGVKYEMFYQNTCIIFFSPPSCRWFAGCNIPAQQVKICQLGGGMNSPPGKSHVTKNKC